MAELSELLEQEYGDKIPQRIADYSKAIDFFTEQFYKEKQNSNLHLSVADHAARNLAYLYFKWCYTLVKPSVKELADRYKIASTTQFAICYLQPFTIAEFDAERNRSVNANFAFFTALNIILNFNDSASITRYSDTHLSFSGAIAPLEEKMERLLENHRRYMASLNNTAESPAIISNAFTLELIDMFYKFQWQVLMI